jgi:hypothetical protein
MAQGLPLTPWAGGAETPATQPRTPLEGWLTGEMQVGRLGRTAPHGAAALEGAGCPAPLANRMQETGSLD